MKQTLIVSLLYVCVKFGVFLTVVVAWISTLLKFKNCIPDVGTIQKRQKISPKGTQGRHFCSNKWVKKGDPLGS